MADTQPTLKVGDRIKDNDPRMQPRVLTIERFDGEYAMARQGTQANTSRISTQRIYTDGKPRKSGFSLLKE